MSKTLSIVHKNLPEQSRRLGRHVHHDARSKGFPAKMASAVVNVRHQRNVPIFDQGSLGSCTGNAAVGSYCTAPFSGKNLTEKDAIEIYSAATRLDNISGVYPPNDTGSNGLSVMKAMKQKGWIKGYTHAFGLDHVLKALVLVPGITGITWLTGCDSPDAEGVVKYEGAVRGGHEIELVGIDTSNKRVWFANSWGPSWGKDGYFAMSWDDYAKALADHGDATFALP